MCRKYANEKECPLYPRICSVCLRRDEQPGDGADPEMFGKDDE